MDFCKFSLVLAWNMKRNNSQPKKTCKLFSRASSTFMKTQNNTAHSIDARKRGAQCEIAIVCILNMESYSKRRREILWHQKLRLLCKYWRCVLTIITCSLGYRSTNENELRYHTNFLEPKGKHATINLCLLTLIFSQSLDPILEFRWVPSNRRIGSAWKNEEMMWREKNKFYRAKMKKERAYHASLEPRWRCQNEFRLRIFECKELKSWRKPFESEKSMSNGIINGSLSPSRCRFSVRLFFILEA